MAQGTIERWVVERGFGFIAPEEGGEEVFAHIKAFAVRDPAPRPGARVRYRLARDAQGRRRAEEVAYVGGVAAPHPARARPSPRSVPPRLGGGQGALWGRLVLGVAALAALYGLVRSGALPGWAGAVLAGLSAVTFVAYGLDKGAAVRQGWRTAETRLHLLALLGGWPGALLAQALFRHKHRKTTFLAQFWVTVVLNVAALGFAIVQGPRLFLG